MFCLVVFVWLLNISVCFPRVPYLFLPSSYIFIYISYIVYVWSYTCPISLSTLSYFLIPGQGPGPATYRHKPRPRPRPKATHAPPSTALRDAGDNGLVDFIMFYYVLSCFTVVFFSFRAVAISTFGLQLLPAGPP